MKRIVLTGGGSAGHVTPHLALLPKLVELQWDVHYIGTRLGIEKELMADLVPYYAISAGKLRRYFDLKNFSDPLRVIKGAMQAFWILIGLRPHIIFSKGGFVSVPVAVAAKMLRIPVVLHESDMTPGLANRLALPFATHLCVTFPETLKHVKKGRATVTGNPVRDQLFTGEADQGYQICNFTKNKPVILVIGGSLGAVAINGAIREIIPILTKEYQVAHICGQGNVDTAYDRKGYIQFSYVKEDLPHFFAMADYVISRAGSNSLFELLALRKPSILIPLSRAASRGDQILNAQSFANQGFSLVLPEEELTPKKLGLTINKLAKQRRQLIQTMETSPIRNSTDEVLKVLIKYA